jgi:hypothetical protein
MDRQTSSVSDATVTAPHGLTVSRTLEELQRAVPRSPPPRPGGWASVSRGRRLCGDAAALSACGRSAVGGDQLRVSTDLTVAWQLPTVILAVHFSLLALVNTPVTTTVPWSPARFVAAPE